MKHFVCLNCIIAENNCVHILCGYNFLFLSFVNVNLIKFFGNFPNGIIPKWHKIGNFSQMA